ncbi:MAG: MotA/TolQ/ExbB proton channel family protein [Planctomycetota bacterium]
MADWLSNLWAEAVAIWLSGGWAMWPLATIALAMFAIGVHVRLRLRATGFRDVPEDIWRRWIERPRERRGPIGRLLEFAMGGDASDKDIAARFEQLRLSETVPFERDLKVMKVCVGAAPLMGLLGTVTGMLATFGALASGSGGDETMAMVAKGISEALITTETGLVVALPGVFFQYQLSRRFQYYKAFLAHLETVCTQTMHRRVQQGARRLLQRNARDRIAEQLRSRLRDERIAN